MPERTALVTGASRGIGRATALALARWGARVAAVSRSAELLEQLAQETGIEPIVASIDTPRGCAEAVRAARERVGPIAILVNNAGRGGWNDRPIWEQDREGWRASMDVNLDAPFEHEHHEVARLALAEQHLSGRQPDVGGLRADPGEVVVGEPGEERHPPERRETRRRPVTHGSHGPTGANAKATAWSAVMARPSATARS